MSLPNAPSPSVDLNSLRSEILELRNSCEDSELTPLETEKLLNFFAVEFEGRISQIVTDCSSNLSSLPDEELDEFLGNLKKELNSVEGENAKIECEIEELSRRCAEDSDKLEAELEKLSCSLKFIESQNYEKDEENMQIDFPHQEDYQANFSSSHDSSFKMLELSHQIEKNETTLKSLQDLDSILQRFEAAEKIEDALTGLRVVEFEGNRIRLSLKTYIPNLESVLFHQGIEGVIEPLEMDHELIIETVDGTLDLKNAEIFPDDISIDEIVDAAKSFRQLYPSLNNTTRSSLEWFARKVQDRIVLSSLRRFVVKKANKSRHSFEYLDKENTIVAHMVGGVDAFIKLSQGWPLTNSALELISLKGTGQYSKEISSNFLCKIVEVANSMNEHLRQKVSSFVDSIEETLAQQTRTRLQPGNSVAGK